MKPHRIIPWTAALFPTLLALLWVSSVSAAPATFTRQNPAPYPPTLLTVSSNGTATIEFGRYPAADEYKLLTGPAVTALTDVFPSLAKSNATFTHTVAGSSNHFFGVQVKQLSSNAVLAVTALSKLAYGPTPALLDRLLQGTGTNTAETWINEQLNPEIITERATAAHTNIAFIESRFGTPTNLIVSSQQTNTGPGTAATTDLQAWLVLRAVFADRQLLEVLTQFWDNHFVTFLGKSANFFVGAQYRDGFPQRAASEWEWREVSGWRAAMLRPNWTFYDMLRVSAESCAMINYLDTATSRGNPPNIPNENYSRELEELFAMGVDNGYDQTDITNMAPCWTGWTTELVNVTNAYNPFAPRTTIKRDPSGPNAFTNLVGVWVMNFKSQFHATGSKRIWGGKTVPARFGPPYTTKLYGANAVPGLYELNIPARTGTNGIQDGYDIIRHLASLPFTQEFLSVKLCRLFVHEDFHLGYDYTSPNLSEEGQLVKACMAAWESNNGQMRPVLATIFNSALFRSHQGNAQKIKTPLEFCTSAIRALRQSSDGSGSHGTWTAFTDGYGLVASQGGGQRGGLGSPLVRMGSMSLFNREEPDGFPEAGSAWSDAGSLAERIRFISSLLKATGQTGKNDANQFLNNNITLPVNLLQLRLPSATDQRDATKVANVFLGLLFSGEGQANLDAYGTLAVNFLNTDDTGAGSSPFSMLTVSGVPNSAYDTRVRSLVAMLMSLQRMQEQ